MAFNLEDWRAMAIQINMCSMACHKLRPVHYSPFVKLYISLSSSRLEEKCELLKIIH